MTDDKTVKLVRYLYPTDEIRNFLCNDLFQELLEHIPSAKCFDNSNKNESIRKQNCEYVKNEMKKFINSNNNYITELVRLYRTDNVNELFNDILIGFVFYIVNTNKRLKNINIFKDKRSICYSEISIFDIL